MKVTENIIKLTIDSLQSILGSEYEIKQFTDSYKLQSAESNPVIAIVRKGHECVATPAVNLNDVFAHHTFVDEAVKEIVLMYDRHKGHLDFNPETELTLEKSKNLLTLKLVSTRQDLSQYPHRLIFDDIAVIMQRQISINGRLDAVLSMSKDCFELMGKSFDELYELAKANTERLFPPIVMGMEEFMLRLSAPDDIPDKVMDKVVNSIDKEVAYIITTQAYEDGAVAFIYNGMLEYLTKRFGEFAVIPVTKHEMLIFPNVNGLSPDNLKDLLTHANFSSDDEDKLSNGIFIFKNGKLIK